MRKADYIALFIVILTVTVNIILILTLFRDFGFFSKYVTIGNDIIRDGLVGFSKSFEYSPFYSAICALFSIVFGSQLIYYAVLICVISGINMLLLVLITKRLFDERTAYISAIIYLFSSTLYVYNTDLLAAPLVILLNMSCLLAFLLYTDNPEKKVYLILSGLFLGLSVITRPNILIFAVLLSIYILVNPFRRHVLFFILPILLCILPVTVVNYMKSGEFILVEDSGPAVLYSSNNYNSIGIGYSPPGVLHVLESRYTRDQAFTPDTMEIFKEIAEALHNSSLRIGEINKFYLRETKKQVLGNPKRYISLSVKRIWYSLHFFSDYDVISSLRRGNHIRGLFFLIPTGFIIVFGITGLVFFGKQHIKYPVILIYLASYLAFFFLFYVTERLRLPVVFMFIPFASYCLHRIYDIIKEKNFEKLITVIISLFILSLVLSYENRDIAYRREHTKPKFLYLNNMIMGYYGDDINAIIENGKKILEIDPLYQPAWYYINSTLINPSIDSEQIEQIYEMRNIFSRSYSDIINEYKSILSKNIFDLEAIKFVSSYNVHFPQDSEEFNIVPDMIDTMKMLSPADPEIYYIEAVYYQVLRDFERSRESIKKAIDYGILYSSHYKESALVSANLFLMSGDRDNALGSLYLLKNLFPDDRDFQQFIDDRNLRDDLGALVQ